MKGLLFEDILQDTHNAFELDDNTNNSWYMWTV